LLVSGVTRDRRFETFNFDLSLKKGDGGELAS